MILYVRYMIKTHLIIYLTLYYYNYIREIHMKKHKSVSSILILFLVMIPDLSNTFSFERIRSLKNIDSFPLGYKQKIFGELINVFTR